MDSLKKLPASLPHTFRNLLLDHTDDGGGGGGDDVTEIDAVDETSARCADLSENSQGRGLSLSSNILSRALVSCSKRALLATLNCDGFGRAVVVFALDSCLSYCEGEFLLPLAFAYSPSILGSMFLLEAAP